MSAPRIGLLRSRLLRSRLRAALEEVRAAPPSALIPEAPPLPRRLCVAVRLDGSVVFFLRAAAGPPGAWELSADAWRELAARVGRALDDPARWGGAVMALGQERVDRRTREVEGMAAAALELSREIGGGV